MSRHFLPATLAVLLAAGIAVAAILGPLVLGVIRFHMTDAVENQYLGGEIVSLLVVAPALVVAGVLWHRGDRLAPALAFGPAIYTVYTFITAILGQEYARFPGNAEKAFFLYVALIAGGVTLAVLAGAGLAAQPASPLPEGLRRSVAGVFLTIVLFFALAWIGQIAQFYRGERTTEYIDSPTLFWLIKLLDLGFLLPVFAAMGVGMLQRHPAALKLGYGMIAYAVCMTGAILGMAIAMFLKDDPAASPAMVAFLGPVLAVLGWLAFRMLVIYRRGNGELSARTDRDVRHAA